MPQVKTDTETPDTLRPFFFHGVDLAYKSSSKEAVGDCPFCGREGKFSVTVQTGQWRCFSCNEGEENGKAIKGGNIPVFLRKVWEFSAKATPDCKVLAEHRGFLDDECLIRWEVVQSFLTKDWLVPGYNVDGHLNQLYKYNGKVLYATAGVSQQLHGVNLYDENKPILYLCEGPWDGMALWEVLKNCKESNGRLIPTAAEANSMLAESNVLAVPGCQTFLESWLPLFAGKSVRLMFDNDHPRKHPKTGKEIPPGGLEGMKRVAKILSESPTPPESIQYLKWGKDHFDLNLPSGHDVRDYLSGK